VPLRRFQSAVEARWHDRHRPLYGGAALQKQALIALADASSVIMPMNNQRKIKDIKWICSEAIKLETDRNNVIHSPLWGIPRFEGMHVAPVARLGHIRAKNLLGKNLLADFRWCRDTITALRNYTMEIDIALNRGGAWPKRPRLPVRPAPIFPKAVSASRKKG